jgi:hypothetical protein
VREFNQLHADHRDVAKIFMAALDQDTMIYLETCSTNFTDLIDLVRQLAKRCCPQLIDLITMVQRFRSETPGSRSYEEYYYALLDYNINFPSAISKLLVLVQFLETTPSEMQRVFHLQLVNCPDVPDQATILRIIRAMPPVPQPEKHLAVASKPQPTQPPHQNVSSNVGRQPVRLCHHCKGPHNISHCPLHCINCRAPDHAAMDCPTKCANCGKSGGHVYKYCASNMRVQQQNVLLAPVAPPAAEIPHHLPLGSLVVASQAEPQSVAAFQQQNDGRGQICVRQFLIGGHPAVIGFDTGCAKCTISQEFLSRFDVPPGYLKPMHIEIDNGGPKPIITSHAVVLPLKLQSHNIATEWIIMPRLATPLDALVSWSWAVQLKVIIDCDANTLVFKEPPPPTHCVPADFNLLHLKPIVPAAVVVPAPVA